MSLDDKFFDKMILNILTQSCIGTCLSINLNPLLEGVRHLPLCVLVIFGTKKCIVK